MQQLIKVLSDIFSMGFDIIIPLSGCIVAFVIALVLFLIRYSSFKRNKRRYERKLRREAAAAASSAVQPEDSIANTIVTVVPEMEDTWETPEDEAAVVPPIEVTAEIIENARDGQFDELVADILASSIHHQKDGVSISDCPELDSRFSEEMGALLESIQRGDDQQWNVEEKL